MNLPKQKVKLSRKLLLGVGRNSGRGSLLPYITSAFIILSAVLVLRAGYMVISHSSSQTQSTPQVLGATDTPSTPTAKKAFTDYTIKKGDTVFSIAQKNNIDWTALATLNSLQAPFTLKPGQVIQIPQ